MCAAAATHVRTANSVRASSILCTRTVRRLRVHPASVSRVCAVRVSVVPSVCERASSACVRSCDPLIRLEGAIVGPLHQPRLKVKFINQIVFFTSYPPSSFDASLLSPFWKLTLALPLLWLWLPAVSLESLCGERGWKVVGECTRKRADWIQLTATFFASWASGSSWSRPKKPWGSVRKILKRPGTPLLRRRMWKSTASSRRRSMPPDMMSVGGKWARTWSDAKIGDTWGLNSPSVSWRKYAFASFPAALGSSGSPLCSARDGDGLAPRFSAGYPMKTWSGIGARIAGAGLSPCRRRSSSVSRAPACSARRGWCAAT
mmetsp:Transcript_19269/g.37208  ORF Transcript_19269/g.37208 Transcript_19269/m.37208 type:complete len:317 (-) Transcript_19269:371-1321(-)